MAETSGLLNRRTGSTCTESSNLSLSAQRVVDDSTRREFSTRWMKYFVYILFSPKFHRTYVGQTGNLESRLSYHNNGKVRSTKHYRPWLLYNMKNVRNVQRL